MLYDETMKKNKMFKSGFTMVELLVAVGIIAVLTVVAIVNFGPANKKSRDGRRMADLEKMRIALEMARQIGTTYPTTANIGVLWGSMGLMQTQPRDPKNGTYDYAAGAGNYTYTLRASMEDLGSTNIPAVAGGCGSSCNYEVRSP